MMDEGGQRRRARQLAEMRYGFWWHLGMYAFVNAIFVGIWFFTSSPQGFFWPVFPIIFWGLFVIGHYINAYRRFGGGWIERETEKILREDEGRGP